MRYMVTPTFGPGAVVTHIAGLGDCLHTVVSSPAFGPTLVRSA